MTLHISLFSAFLLPLPSYAVTPLTHIIGPYCFVSLCISDHQSILQLVFFNTILVFPYFVISLYNFLFSNVCRLPNFSSYLVSNFGNSHVHMELVPKLCCSTQIGRILIWSLSPSLFLTKKAFEKCQELLKRTKI